jgi:2-methylcitrate dehydratase PrpD
MRMNDASPTASETICRFAETLRFEDIPPDVVEKAKQLTLDLIGIALAARQDSIDMPLRATARALAGKGKRTAAEADYGHCSAVGEKTRMPAASAVFLNGALGHSLDFDDTHSKSIVHTTAPVVPPALAGAEAFQRSGREMIRAEVAAMEAVVRIGLAAPGKLHAKGFHMTALAGAFGATLAYGLSASLRGKMLTSALGICGSMAAGLMEYLADGSPVKAMHPGWAAHSGIAATYLAGGGFGGPPTILEGRFGLLRSHLGGEEFAQEALTDGLGSRWETLAITFKPYPCGHVIHAFLDAALAAQREGGFRADEIETITCHAAKGAIELTLDPIDDKRRPRTAYDGKFSLPYCLGSVLVRGTCGLDDFTEESIRDEQVLDIAGKVHARQDDTQNFPRFFPGKVEITLKDGRTFTAEEPHQRGCPENPLTPEQVGEKFLQNANQTLSAVQASELMGLITRLETLESVEPITKILREA